MFTRGEWDDLQKFAVQSSKSSCHICGRESNLARAGTETPEAWTSSEKPAAFRFTRGMVFGGKWLGKGTGNSKSLSHQNSQFQDVSSVNFMKFLGIQQITCGINGPAPSKRLGGQQSWAVTAIAKSHQNRWKIARASTFNPCNHKNGGFLKGGYPKTIPKSSKLDHDLVLKPMVTWGCPILGNLHHHMNPRSEAPKKNPRCSAAFHHGAQRKRSRGQKRHGTKLHELQGLTEGLICPPMDPNTVWEGT